MSTGVPNTVDEVSVEIRDALHAAHTDIDAVVARVDAVLAEPLYWFPVRHHSPTIARLLGRVITERKPKILFIEGPAEAQAMIEFVIDEGTRPPVAIFSSYRDDQLAAEMLKTDPLATPPRKAVWYPMVSYSPEYVALRAAKQIGAEAVFMDLPHYAIGRTPLEEKSEPLVVSDLADLARDSSFYQALAKAAGRRTWDETWDTLFECAEDDVSIETFRREVALFCAGVRATTAKARLLLDGTLERERFMWKTIQDTLRDRKIRPEEAMVVCGGFHLFLDRNDSVAPPAIPEGTVSTTLAPYSYFRISELSGYGAGNRAPRFYEMCYDNAVAGSDRLQIVIDHVAEVIKQARRRGDALSTADAISATQHALLLSRLRGRRSPVLDDIHDALISCCCKGDPRSDAGNLLEAIDEVNIGTRLGRVTAKAGRLPIVNDFYDQLARLDLEEIAAHERVQTYTLDKRQPNDAARSAFFHRLVYLEAEIGQVQREQAPFGQSVFKEQWRVKWNPKIEPALIEKNLHGQTIEFAATTVLRERLAGSGADAASAARQLVQAIDMDLPLLVAQAEQSCGRAVDQDDRFRSLASALSSLLLLERYAAYRQMAGTTLAELIRRCFDRACFAVPEVASVPLDQWDAVVEGLLALAEPVMQRDDLDADLFAGHVERAARESTMPFLRGAFLGVLAEMRRIKPQALAAELTAYARGSVEQQVVAGDFLHGVLKVSRTAILLGATELVRAVDELLRVAERETFLSMIPRLRAAFDTLHDRQRDGLAIRVAEMYGLKESESLRTLNTSVGAAQLMAELDGQVAVIMQEWFK